MATPTLDRLAVDVAAEFGVDTTTSRFLLRAVLVDQAIVRGLHEVAAGWLKSNGAPDDLVDDVRLTRTFARVQVSRWFEEQLGTKRAPMSADLRRASKPARVAWRTRLIDGGPGDPRIAAGCPNCGGTGKIGCGDQPGVVDYYERCSRCGGIG